MWGSLKRILGIPIILLIVCWIIFNPYVFYSGSLFVVNATSQINNFCSGLNLSYHFLTGDILGLLRFLEYFIFGIIAMNMLRVYFKNFYQNIVNSLFLGLLVSVLEVYYRDFGIYKLETKDILYSFCEFCIGVLILCIFVGIRPKKRFLSKYKKNNYNGRS